MNVSILMAIYQLEAHSLGKIIGYFIKIWGYIYYSTHNNLLGALGSNEC